MEGRWVREQVFPCTYSLQAFFLFHGSSYVLQLHFYPGLSRVFVKVNQSLKARRTLLGGSTYMPGTGRQQLRFLCSALASCGAVLSH